MQLEALIFDVDGTLCETEEIHRRAFNETFAGFGLDWHWDRARYRVLLRTTGGKERMLRHARDIGMAIDAEQIAELHAAKTSRYVKLLGAGDAVLRPGIAELIDAARREGLRLAIATTTSRPNVDALSEAAFRAPADAVFDVIAAGDEVAAKKPAPDVYELALHRLGLAAKSCLAFEDSRNGLVSAHAAGIATLVSPSVYTQGEDFTEALACLADFGSIAGTAGLRALHAEAVHGRTAA